MRHRTRRGIQSVLFAALYLAMAVPAWQSADAAEGDREERRRTYLLSRQVGKKLQEVVELIAGENVTEEQMPANLKVAKALLRDLADKRSLNPLESAQIHQMLGFVAASEEEYELATREFEKCLAEQGLPFPAEHNLRFNLSQLYLATEQWDKAVEMLETWFVNEENPPASAYYLLAAGYYQSGHQDRALDPAEQAVLLSQEPKQQWLALLVALYFENKDYEKLSDALEQLANRFPKKAYFLQLAAVYAELGREEDSLAVQQLAYLSGYLDKGTEMRRLAQMYSYHRIPYWGARILEKGLEEETVEADAETYELLANSWITAREYASAIDPLKTAADLSEGCKLFVRLGQVYFESESWGDARDALASGLDRSCGDEDTGRSYILLGIANFNLDRISEAERAFRSARSYENVADEAGQWLKHVETLRTRSQRLAGI